MMTEHQKNLLLVELLRTFVEAVKAGGKMGAPAGVMYSAVCDKISLSQFQQIMSALVAMGKVRKAGDLYHFVADV